LHKSLYLFEYTIVRTHNVVLFITKKLILYSLKTLEKLIKKTLNTYCKFIKYAIILIVNSKTTNLDCAIIFILQIKSITKFKLAINLKNTTQYLIKDFVKVFLTLRNFKAYLLLFTKLLC